MASRPPDERRFEHLLKPIRCVGGPARGCGGLRTSHPTAAALEPPACRDLAQNWNIDVAKDLEEYLDELDQIEISFDGGKTTMNFAEAALVIQARQARAAA